MPTGGAPWDARPVTRSVIVRDLSALGVRTGSILMVHTRMSAIGWVVGGSETVVRAVLDAVGPDGTVMAYAGWEENPYHLGQWPAEWQRAYLEELPAFDPRLSEARHDRGPSKTSRRPIPVPSGTRRSWATRTPSK